MIIKDKKEKYKQVVQQVESIISGEPDLIANLANITAILKMNFEDFSWVGFYLWRFKELVLGPFQGKPACVRIKKGKGVCGTSIKDRKTIIVPDVSQFEGHIYCDHETKSEIVIPMIKEGHHFGVLDVDSYKLNTFDDIDKFYLEYIVKHLMDSIVEYEKKIR
ncbi:MAG: GAF domain-containing protein [Bacteroidetes bacterium]|nr:GAF domain-containing protein [Bacteroidota bacterium]MBU1422989.1 GAF domain-containing protein [Bacteroidota bacterium]MBU2637158.1 GAF domain-containing protein [Bacteroidota bacterium]